MKKVFDILVELIFWLAIFASPFLIAVVISAIIYISNENLLELSILILVTGFAIGIFIAERIRKKYGCENYIARLFN